jgi:hypothetical protein
MNQSSLRDGAKIGLFLCNDGCNGHTGIAAPANRKKLSGFNSYLLHSNAIRGASLALKPQLTLGK